MKDRKGIYVSAILSVLVAVFIGMVIWIPSLTVKEVKVSVYSDAYMEDQTVHFFWNENQEFNGDQKTIAEVGDGKATVQFDLKDISENEFYRFDMISKAENLSIKKIDINNENIPIEEFDSFILSKNQCDLEVKRTDGENYVADIVVYGDDPYIIFNSSFSRMMENQISGMNNKKIALIMGSMLLLGLLILLSFNKVPDDFYKKYGTVFSGLIVFFMGCIVSEWWNITEYVYDSANYWEIGQNLFHDGKLFLDSFPETFRGYFIYFIVGLVSNLGRALKSEFWGWRVYSNAIFSIVFCVNIPILFGKRIDSKKIFIRMILGTVAVLGIWGNYLQYPLSDLSAIFFLSGAIILLKSTLERKKHLLIVLLKSIVAGGMLYAAYNTRAAYLYGGIIVGIIYIFCLLKKRQNVIAIVGILLGISLVAIPQSLINYKYVGSYLPKVHTEQYSGYVGNLQMQQVCLGLQYEKYESYIGESSEYSQNAVYYDDAAGSELIRRENIHREDFSFAKWVQLVLKYPMDMIALYMRHLIGLISPMYNQLYIEDMHTAKGILCLLSIMVWLLVWIGAKNAYLKKKFSWRYSWIFALIVPELLQLFGAPEIRFFMLINLLAYFYVFVCFDFSIITSQDRRTLVSEFCTCIIIALLWITVYSNILSDTREQIMLINDSSERYEEYREGIWGE